MLNLLSRATSSADKSPFSTSARARSHARIRPRANVNNRDLIKMSIIESVKYERLLLIGGAQLIDMILYTHARAHTPLAEQPINASLAWRENSQQATTPPPPPPPPVHLLLLPGQERSGSPTTPPTQRVLPSPVAKTFLEGEPKFKPDLRRLKANYLLLITHLGDIWPRLRCYVCVCIRGRGGGGAVSL